MAGTLFAYGSLRVDHIMRVVSGVEFPSQQATLKGYGCYLVKGQTYPGLIEEQSVETEGCIYIGITEAAWKRLDVFEGAFYDRIDITVSTETDPSVPAQAYVVSPEKREMLSSDLWNYDYFLEHGLETFMRLYMNTHRP